MACSCTSARWCTTGCETWARRLGRYLGALGWRDVSWVEVLKKWPLNFCHSKKIGWLLGWWSLDDLMFIWYDIFARSWRDNSYFVDPKILIPNIIQHGCPQLFGSGSDEIIPEVFGFFFPFRRALDPSGSSWQFANLKMVIEIVDLLIKEGVFPYAIVILVYLRVYLWTTELLSHILMLQHKITLMKNPSTSPQINDSCQFLFHQYRYLKKYQHVHRKISMFS